MEIVFILYLFASLIIQKNIVVKKDLFSQKFNVLVTFLGFLKAHSGAGILRASKDDPPVVVIPPTK